jgi:hypothetical protein
MMRQPALAVGEDEIEICTIICRSIKISEIHSLEFSAQGVIIVDKFGKIKNINIPMAIYRDPYGVRSRLQDLVCMRR